MQALLAGKTEGLKALWQGGCACVEICNAGISEVAYNAISCAASKCSQNAADTKSAAPHLHVKVYRCRIMQELECLGDIKSRTATPATTCAALSCRGTSFAALLLREGQLVRQAGMNQACTGFEVIPSRCWVRAWQKACTSMQTPSTWNAGVAGWAYECHRAEPGVPHVQMCKIGVVESLVQVAAAAVFHDHVHGVLHAFWRR